MRYVRLWTAMGDHKKWMALSMAERGAWATLAMLAGQAEPPGGFEDRETAELLLRREGADDPAAHIDRLLAVGLLDEPEGRLELHDWPDWQFRYESDTPEATRERQRQSRARRRDTRDTRDITNSHSRSEAKESDREEAIARDASLSDEPGQHVLSEREGSRPGATDGREASLDVVATYIEARWPKKRPLGQKRRTKLTELAANEFAEGDAPSKAYAAILRFLDRLPDEADPIDELFDEAGRRRANGKAIADSQEADSARRRKEAAERANGSAEGIGKLVTRVAPRPAEKADPVAGL